MLNNTNSTLSQSIDSNDRIGAAIFIVVILLWYSSSFVFLLAMQITKSNQKYEKSGKGTAQMFVESFHDRNNNKEILEELVNKENRDKLWDIYLGKSKNMNDKIFQADTVRIRNIKKQLKTMGGYRRDSQWSSDIDLAKFDSRFYTRRRSSTDRRILEEWKTLADELKTREHWPWAIQKLIIRRHLRRHRHASESRSVF